MTFDDGIIQVYGVKNISSPGNKPKDGLYYKSSHYISYDKVGITRFYAAKAVSNQIDDVVNIQQDRSIISGDVAIMEDGTQFMIVQAQQGVDENGLRISILSLERIGDTYGEIKYCP